MSQLLPNQRVRIITVQIAVPECAGDNAVSTDLDILLTEHGVNDPESPIVAWTYPTFDRPVVVAGAAGDGDEVFEGVDATVCVERRKRLMAERATREHAR